MFGAPLWAHVFAFCCWAVSKSILEACALRAQRDSAKAEPKTIAAETITVAAFLPFATEEISGRLQIITEVFLCGL